MAACDWLQGSSALAGEAVSHHYLNCVALVVLCVVQCDYDKALE